MEDNILKNEIVTTNNQLPVNLEDLSKFVLIGREKLISVKAEIRAMKKLDIAKEVREQKKEEAQNLAELLIDAEVRIGQLTKLIEPSKGLRTDLELSNSAVTRSKKEQLENLGFSKMDTSRFEQLADNPESVEMAKEKAKENNEVINRTAILKEIQDIKKAELKRKREQLKEQTLKTTDSKKSEIVFFNCDCFEFLKETKDNTVDCIVTDPPYSVTDNSWDNFKSEASFLKFIDKVLSECKRVLKPNYAFFMFMDSRLMSKVEELIIKNKFDLKSRIIWVRKNMSMGRVVKDRFISQWEICFYCGNKELNFPEVWGEERGDVQEAAVPQTNYEDKKIHPTQKPLKIVERFIELSTNQGDIVIDPFCGGGTTAAACYNLGRHCSTSDISKEYIDNAKARIFGHG